MEDQVGWDSMPVCCASLHSGSMPSSGRRSLRRAMPCHAMPLCCCWCRCLACCCCCSLHGQAHASLVPMAHAASSVTMACFPSMRRACAASSRAGERSGRGKVRPVMPTFPCCSRHELPCKRMQCNRVGRAALNSQTCTRMPTTLAPPPLLTHPGPMTTVIFVVNEWLRSIMGMESM